MSGTTIEYGKAEISVYRTYAAPLRVAAIPESSFTGRANTLLAAHVDVDVYGDNFLPAYTEGDNRDVVATDTMKNFVYTMTLAYDGATLEGLAAYLARRFLETYPQMNDLRLTVREIPFAEAAGSDVLLRRERGDAGTAEVSSSRLDGAPAVTAARSGRVSLQLIKLTGSSFAQFVRDEHTTLPEMVDRPLYIHFDVHWRYDDLVAAVGGDLARYVPSEQVRDVCERVFAEFNSRSIQHLVHEMGRRVLARFPQLSEVSFDAENRLWETARTSDDDAKRKVYTDPHPTFGRIGLVLRREP